MLPIQLRHYGANVIGTAAGCRSPAASRLFIPLPPLPAVMLTSCLCPQDYQRNNVKVIASDAGVTACHNGGTHMSFEDMGIVRGLAHSVVLGDRRGDV